MGTLNHSQYNNLFVKYLDLSKKSTFNLPSHIFAAIATFNVYYNDNRNVEPLIININKFLKSNKNSAEYYFLLGYFHFIQTFNSIEISINENTSNNYNFHFNRINVKKAVANFVKAAKFEPGNVFNYIFLFGCYLLLHDRRHIDYTIERLKTAMGKLKLNKKEIAIITIEYNKIKLLERLKNSIQFIKLHNTYEALRQINEINGKMLYHGCKKLELLHDFILFWIYREQNDYETALWWLESAIYREPDSPLINDLLGQGYLGYDNLKAFNYFKKAANLYPPTSSRHNLCKILYEFSYGVNILNDNNLSDLKSIEKVITHMNNLVKDNELQNMRYEQGWRGNYVNEALIFLDTFKKEMQNKLLKEFNREQIDRLIKNLQEFRLEYRFNRYYELTKLEDTKLALTTSLAIMKNVIADFESDHLCGKDVNVNISLNIPIIYFGPKRIKFNTTEESPLRDNQPMQLLEYFILKGKLHYLYGYIIFKEWRQRKIENPQLEFNDIKSKLIGPRKGIFTKYKLTLKIQSTIINPDFYELSGSYSSNFDYLRTIFGQNPKIEDFTKDIKKLSQKELKDLQNLLIQKLIDYENGIQAISKWKNNIKDWNDNANIAFNQIISEKELISNILVRFFNVSESEPNDSDKLKEFEDCKSFIDFVKVFDINCFNKNELMKGILDEEIYRSIWDEILRQIYEDKKIKANIEAKILIEKIIYYIKKVDIDWIKFETKSGFINYLCAKAKRQFKSTQNSEDPNKTRYLRYLRDFKRISQQLSEELKNQPTYEIIAKRLIDKSGWSVKRFWNFISLTEYIEKQKVYDDETDKTESNNDDVF